MRLLLDPEENRAHGDHLRETPGAYEWWYFDACSDDGQWAFAAVWFLGNPFSPYYRLASLGRPADPFAHNAVFFALYKDARLHAYHFTRFPRHEIRAAEAVPLALRFGPCRVSQSAPGVYQLSLRDENANRRTLCADFVFTGPPLAARGEQTGGNSDPSHIWLPAAPACRVSGTVVLREKQNAVGETLAFKGHGYHDHNGGALPFDARDWHWARASLGPEQAVVLYALGGAGASGRGAGASGRLLRCEGGTITVQDACITRAQTRINAFGLVYASRVTAQTEDTCAVFDFGPRLDSAPFYVRALCHARVTGRGRAQEGHGLGEYFRPTGLAGRLMASATKARIVNW